MSNRLFRGFADTSELVGYRTLAYPSHQILSPNQWMLIPYHHPFGSRFASQDRLQNAPVGLHAVAPFLMHANFSQGLSS
jgi:hypothetical protein